MIAQTEPTCKCTYKVATTIDPKTCIVCGYNFDTATIVATCREMDSKSKFPKGLIQAQRNFKALNYAYYHATVTAEELTDALFLLKDAMSEENLVIPKRGDTWSWFTPYTKYKGYVSSSIQPRNRIKQPKFHRKGRFNVKSERRCRTSN